MRKRPPGLVAIVVYKAVVAILLTVICLLLIFSVKHQQNLEQFYGSLTLDSKRGVIVFVLEKILSLNPRTLLFSSLSVGIYAVVTSIEAVGLWYEKVWARWLVLVLVGISIPPEIFELIRGFSMLKIIVFLVNIAVFIYLLRDFPKNKAD